MSKSIHANITPKVIKWAREFCSLSSTDAAKKIGVKEIKLSDWENGVSCPTMSQAYKLANIYKFPLASLWLNEPPTDITIPKIRDFRRIYEHEYSHYSYELAIQIRDLTFKRELFLELSNNVGNIINPFNYKITISKINIENAANNIRSFIGLNWDLQKSWKDPRIAFNTIREIIENKNIAVYQLTDISVEECRGFSVYYNTLPIIALNRKDSYTGRLFTLIHELIHLTQNKSCMTNIDSFDSNYESIDSSEFLINEITAAVLIPSKNFKKSK